MESQIKASGRFAKRATLVGVVILFLAAAILVPMILSARGRTARLEVIKTEPLTVRGSNFDDGEPVRLRVVTDQTTEVRRVNAGDQGSFQIRFEQTGVDRCSSGLVVEALGATGTRVTTKILPVACPVKL